MSDRAESLALSELNKVIPAEIKGDSFYRLISRIVATNKIRNILEIGSSAGGGSTEAFVRGILANPFQPQMFCVEVSRPRYEVLAAAYKKYSFVHCYNMSTVSVDEFPSEEKVADFYSNEESRLTQYALAEVLGWRSADIQYVRDGGVRSGAIDQIRTDHSIVDFDVVLIDGSEFTGEVEFEKVQGAKIIMLDDTCTFKTWHVRKRLLADPNYVLAFEDPKVRNGFSIFHRRDFDFSKPGDDLPIHFFTIVLNGEPFIRYHEKVLSELTLPWHWHIIEGVASLTHDTAWSVPGGGAVSPECHDRGRSNDGTSVYLDELALRFPDLITLYRKPLGQLWDGKREMCNAPLSNINEHCLLWQIDSDELWTIAQIYAVHRLFEKNPAKNAAAFWCDYFVGPNKAISTRYNYAQNPHQEWRRTWRFQPSDHWAAHEPPTLVRPMLIPDPTPRVEEDPHVTPTEPPAGWVRRIINSIGSFSFGRASTAPIQDQQEEPARMVWIDIDIASLGTFSQDEMEEAGAVFQHFAYVTEAQLQFKELYYGYAGALEGWRLLQRKSGPGFLRDYLPWVTDATIFDDTSSLGLKAIARENDNRWEFVGSGNPREASSIQSAPRIVIDGYFFQLYKSGIARVWSNLLREWSIGGFGRNLIVLDRGGSAPRFKDIHYFPLEKYDLTRAASDSIRLEAICRRLDADLFISTYYTTPLTTPSVFMGHDMIPEVLGLDLEEAGWREKRRAINHASAHIMVSRNSARDLERLMPYVRPNSTAVAHCGVDPAFEPSTLDAVSEFCAKHHLTKPYILLVGDRSGAGGYKNGILAFDAFVALPQPSKYTLVCVGGWSQLEENLALKIREEDDVRKLDLTDDELAAAYSGAHVLIYPSKYEGFGLPVIEAMACGCPVVTCRNSSLIEVAGEAAFFVGEHDPAGLAAFITKLEDDELREGFRKRGLEQAARFDFKSMAATIEAVLRDTYDKLEKHKLLRPGMGWSELRRTEQSRECMI